MSDSSTTPAEAAKAEAAKQAVILVAGLIMVVIYTIGQRSLGDPDFLGTLRMRLAEGSRRLLTLLARRAGHTSMGIELQTGSQQYDVPLLLSRLRDKAAEVYDRERGH